MLGTAQPHFLAANQSKVCTNLIGATDTICLGTLTFEEGEHEANIEIVVCREMAHCEASFRIDLEDPADRAEFAVPSTNVTVIRDKGNWIVLDCWLPRNSQWKLAVQEFKVFNIHGYFC